MKINGVEILVNARVEEVDRIEIIVSDETIGNEENTVERREDTVEVGTVEATVERQEDNGNGEETAGPHYCNVNCSC